MKIYTDGKTHYDENGIPLGVRILPNGSLAPRIDAIGEAWHPFKTDWITYSVFKKFDDDDPDNQKIKYVKKEYHIEWANVKRYFSGAKELAKRLGINPKLAYQIGAIAVDSNNSNSTPATTGTVTSYSHTCTGSNLYLIMAYNFNWGINAGDARTYAGTNMTNRVNSTTNLSNAIICDLVNPATGANTLSLTIGSANTWATTTKGHQSGISFTGAAQSGQPDATGTSTGSSTGSTLSITTVADNCMIVDTIGVADVAPTVDAAQTQAYQAAGIAVGADHRMSVSYKLVTAACAKTMAWTWSGTRVFDHAALSLSPAAVTAAANHFLLMGA